MILPPEVNHDGPHGRVLAPPDDLAWARDGRPLLAAVPRGREKPPPLASGLVQVAGKYFAAPGCQTAPCHVCGTPQPVVLTLARGDPYAICPARDNAACVGRAVAERRAVTDLVAEPPKPARKRPLRASQARKTLLGQSRARAARAAAAGTEAAPEPLPEATP